MPLLINSNKTGYLQLLSDRAKIFKRILTLEEETTELKRILEEFNESVDLMKSLFSPKVEITADPENSNVYIGSMIIKYPKSEYYKFELGNINEFEDSNDVKLQSMAKAKATEFLEKEFPDYFL